MDNCKVGDCKTDRGVGTITDCPFIYEVLQDEAIQKNIYSVLQDKVILKKDVNFMSPSEIIEEFEKRWWLND